ncbi:MAG: hypothetical protein SFY68_13945 [Candidatus Sumerlaeia bacterium]|nr:hypothetical protein [Candidatus Sumerlaeia bacterium]
MRKFYGFLPLFFLGILFGCVPSRNHIAEVPITVVKPNEVHEKDSTKNPNISPVEYLEYAVLDLPRDLIDLPLTDLRRLGFADLDTGIEDDDPATPITLDVGTGLGAAGTVAGLIVLGVAFPYALVGILPGAFLGLTAGMNASFIIGDVGAFVKENFQVPLLRGGVDDEDYFPHWRKLHEKFSNRSSRIME